MAIQRSTKLILLGGAAVALLITLGLSIQESRTIVVSATPNPVPTAASAIVAGQLASPRYTGQNAQGLWEVTAATATQRASGTQSGAQTGSISLTDVAARWEPEHAPPLALQAPLASFTPSDSQLSLPPRSRRHRGDRALPNPAYRHRRPRQPTPQSAPSQRGGFRHAHTTLE